MTSVMDAIGAREARHADDGTFLGEIGGNKTASRGRNWNRNRNCNLSREYRRHALFS
ncbi:hypothetical protein GCM10008018_66440 [Paenibacillus marchantiophytorum]|uniref:Uncharacterized protein n=1 Tax=Paenibacillus marchantiophytorum TaxID=1619310 RepID=A0ABQ1FH97_9BACL|nr:hypothetical protein GCM10008018_66440 [Paenibacillus marchantiophytorum]